MMIKQFLLVLAVGAMSLISNKAAAEHVAVDQWVRAGGCDYHVTGWVNVDGDGNVNHWDFTADGRPCDPTPHGFVGDVTNNPSGGVDIHAGATLQNLTTGKSENPYTATWLYALLAQLQSIYH